MRATRLTLDRTWGADPAGEGAWRFAVWAPRAEEVAVELDERRHAMERDGDGLHRVTLPAAAGQTYRFVLDGESYPDPAARAQAGDVHAASRLVDPGAYRWTTDWTGRPWEEAVIYEMHVGTFTEAGTFAAAAAEMPALAALGITAVELMPVGQFPGDRGWGYDGVLPYAPHPAYGTPEDMRAFVEAAQAEGVMVLLDVVYNHFGPDGAYLHAIAPDFFDAGRETPWGAGIDYTRPAVRRYFIENALCWLTEYRLDGLRLDAIGEIKDPSEPELLVELAREIRARDWGRPIHLTTEDERNITHLHDPAAGLYDGEWNDDYHHAVHCLFTGEAEGYYATHAVTPMADLCAALAEGYVEQGAPRPPTGRERGEPSAHLSWTAFVDFNQNHDQIGNRALGERLLSLVDEPQAALAAHALLLAHPGIPMLFMGEEMGSTDPFLFFVNMTGDLGRAVREGRAAEFEAFESFQGEVPDPTDPATFARSRPRPGPQADLWRKMTREVLSLRHERIVPLMKSGRAGAAEVTQTGPRALRAVWPFAEGGLEIRANLGSAPDAASPPATPAWAWNDPARDPYAVAVILS